MAIKMSAQQIKVIELSPEDAKLVSSLYTEQTNIKSQLNSLRLKFIKTYAIYDFDYSEDFRFIIPKPFTINLDTLNGCNTKFIYMDSITSTAPHYTLSNQTY